MKKVSIKVAGQLPELALNLTNAFKEVIINYCDESVEAFTNSVKIIKQVNNIAFESIAGTDVAVGLVAMIAENEGSFINRNPKQVTELLRVIAVMFDGKTEELPDTMEEWLAIASYIIIVPPQNIVTEMKQVGEDKTKDGDKEITTIKTTEASTPETLTPEETKALEGAVNDFVDTVKEIANEVGDIGESIMKEHIEKEKEKKDSLATDILTGVAVVTGIVVVGAGLYYAYKGLFGDDKFEGAM